MYKVIANVSGKRARIVPNGHRLQTAERHFGDISAEDALANRDNLIEAVRGLLEEKGVADSELFTVELPDNLTNRGEARTPPAELQESDGKGPVTKPENPKEGEQNSATNKPEQTPTETPKKPVEQENQTKPGDDLPKQEDDKKTA
jgi:hypothetical protein